MKSKIFLFFALLTASCSSSKNTSLNDIKYIKLVFTTWDSSFGFLVAQDSASLEYAYEQNSGEPLLGKVVTDSALFTIYTFLKENEQDSIPRKKIKVAPAYLIKCYTKSDTMKYSVQGKLLLTKYLDRLANHLKKSKFENEYGIIIKELEFRRDILRKVYSE